MAHLKKKKGPRCFDRDIEDLVKEENEKFPGMFQNVPSVVYLSIKSLAKLKWREGIFRISGNLSIVKDVQAKLDLDDVDFVAIEKELDKIGSTMEGQFAIATLIKKYLLGLPDALVPFAMYQSFIDATVARQENVKIEGVTRVTKELTPCRYETLKCIAQLLNRIQLESEENKMTPDNIGTSLGPSILRGGFVSSSRGMGDLKFVGSFTAVIAKSFDVVFSDTEVKAFYELKAQKLEPIQTDNVVVEKKLEDKGSPSTSSPVPSLERKVSVTKMIPPLPKRTGTLVGNSETKTPPTSTSSKVEPESPKKMPLLPTKNEKPHQDLPILPTHQVVEPESPKPLTKPTTPGKGPNESPIIPVKLEKSNSKPNVPSKTPVTKQEPIVSPKTVERKQEIKLEVVTPIKKEPVKETRSYDVIVEENARLVAEIMEAKHQVIDLQIQLDAAQVEIYQLKNKDRTGSFLNKIQAMIVKPSRSEGESDKMDL